MALRVSFATPHVAPALHHQLPLALLALLDIIARQAIPADLLARIRTVTLISMIKLVNHARLPAFTTALKDREIVTLVILVNITSLILVFAALLARVMQDTMLLTPRPDVFHAGILIA